MVPLTSLENRIPDKDAAVPSPGLAAAVARGLAAQCPSCGHGSIFKSYIKLRPICLSCGLDLSAFPTDDIPAYFTILLVGHIVVGLLLVTEEIWHPALWIHLAIWPALTLGLTLALLPRLKGAILAIQWSFQVRQ
jgi:uncharacterized protein (DUF983 family)